MTREELQVVAFELIGYAGDALSLYFEALEKAKKGEFAQCEALLKQADESMNSAHHQQTDLLCAEAEGKSFEISLIVIHAQDHLMNAVLTKKLVAELIELHKERQTKG